jgi:hypothetical protein
MAKKPHQAKCEGCGRWFMVPWGEPEHPFCDDPACEAAQQSPEVVSLLSNRWYRELDGFGGEGIKEARQN